MIDDGRGVALKSSSSSSRTSDISNRRTRRTDARFVADSPANEVEVDQNELNKIRHEALNSKPIDSAKKVFEYINRGDIEEEKARKLAEEENEKQIKEEEEKLLLESQKPKFFKVLLTEVNRSALLTLFLMTALMILIPIGTFYFSFNILFASVEEKWRLTYSGFLAVFTVNVLTIGFGLYAYYEPEDPESEEEKRARIAGDEARADQWVREITRGRMTGRNQMAKDENEENKEE